MPTQSFERTLKIKLGEYGNVWWVKFNCVDRGVNTKFRANAEN